MSKPRFTPAYPAELRKAVFGCSERTGATMAATRLPTGRSRRSLAVRPIACVWCQQAERDAGQRGGLTSAEKDRIKELEREVRELRQANEILKKASAYFAAAELDRPFRR